jgi:hypothetical protein
MSEVNDGGPAFAALAATAMGDVHHQPGMSLRDYFAIHAPEPSSEAVNLQYNSDRMRNPHNDPHKPRIRSDLEIRAAIRYEYADALLKSREATHG